MKYPDWFKDKLTYGESLGPAMDVQSEEEASKFLEGYVDWIVRAGNQYNIQEAVKVAKQNIGYYSGYYDNETMVRVQRLFNASHPIFGRSQRTKNDNP